MTALEAMFVGSSVQLWSGQQEEVQVRAVNTEGVAETTDVPQEVGK